MNISPPNMTRGPVLSSPLRSFIVARQETLRVLDDQPDNPVHDLARLCAVENGQVVPGDVLDNAQCLFLEVDPDDPNTLNRIAAVRQMRPQLPVIAMISEPEFQLTRTLIRQGIHDVVSLPLKSEDVIAAIIELGAKSAASADNLAPVVAIASPAGGVGATTVITHLAAALAHAQRGKRCCIVDLDIQFGDVASYLGLEPRTSVIDLLNAGDRLDGVMVKDAALDLGRGFSVIAAPDEINPLEDIGADRVQKLLRICRSEFDLVLLDLPSNWTNWVLSTAVSSQHVLLLTEPNLHSIRRARRCLSMFDAVSLGRSHISLVVNRNEKRFFKEISTVDVADTLHRDVIGTLPLENRTITQAQDQGLLVQETSRKARFATAVDDLAEQLLAKLGAESR